MANSIPRGFVTLSAAKRIRIANIMGLVTHFSSPVHSQGGDWSMNLTLMDSTLGSLDRQTPGLEVRIFRSSRDDMPKINGLGDVVVLFNVKLKDYRGDRQMILYSDSGFWIFLQAKDLLDARGSVTSKIVAHKSHGVEAPTMPIISYALQLYQLNDEAAYSTAIASLPNMSSSGAMETQAHSSYKFGFRLLKDFEANKFIDMTGYVVKIWTHPERINLYVTDYTHNPLLYEYRDVEEYAPRDGDEHSYLTGRATSRWPGPFGQKTIMVSLWPPHKQWALQNLHVGEIVSLRKIHTRFVSGQLEGNIHTDHKYPNRIDIFKVTERSSDRVKDLLRRKLDYDKREKSRLASRLKLSDETTSDSGTVKLAASTKEGEVSKTAMTKAQKKKQRLKARIAEERDNASAEHALCKKVLCNRRNEIPCRPIAAIKSYEHHKNTTPEGVSYTLPFANIKSRAKVRVVDYMPYKLEDFSVYVPRAEREYRAALNGTDSDPAFGDLHESDEDGSEEISTHESSEGEDEDDSNESIQRSEMASNSRKRYEWRFKLLLECDLSNKYRNNADAPVNEDDLLEVVLSGPEAEYFLQLDPVNLRCKPLELEKLRARMAVLWNDLETHRRSEQSDSSAIWKRHATEPFECCLEEFGIAVELNGRREWERAWKMFGCTIV